MIVWFIFLQFRFIKDKTDDSHTFKCNLWRKYNRYTWYFTDWPIFPQQRVIYKIIFNQTYLCGDLWGGGRVNSGISHGGL